MAYLTTRLDSAVACAATPAELERHLDGISAIMKSHFRYEERNLLIVLETLALDADPRWVLGPLNGTARPVPILRVDRTDPDPHAPE